MVLGAFVTYVSRSSCAAQPRTSRPFLRAGADFGGVSSWSAVLCGCGGTGPRARAHVRVLSLYSQLLLLPHSNSSNTSRGRPGARHPPLRGDSATPGRLPAALRRRLDHDGQARSTRPERALLPGFFGLGQPTWAGGAAGHICRGCSEDAGPWATRPLGSCRSRCCCSAAAANLFRPCVGTRLLLLPRLYAAACRLHCRRSRSRGRDEQARLTLRLDSSQGLQP